MAESSHAPAPPRTISQGPDPLIGRTVNDRFKISALIARGGMGKVYRAEQAPLGRQVALKVLNPNYSGEHDPEFHKRFFLEASICAKLTHPNTVTIFDYGRTDDDIYYIAMELLEGRTLYKALREESSFEPARAMHIARQICRSLREAHALGVIHRDLKPANVFLIQHGDETDVVKVLDFGLVKNLDDKSEDLTQTGLFMGSPKYMAPEQIQGERTDARADIYSLGVMLYEMLTGKVPFDRPNSVNILMAHVHEAPPPLREMRPDLVTPPALEQLVFRCMAKSPDARFANMDELLLALKHAGAESGFLSSRSDQFSGEFHVGPSGSYPPVRFLDSSGNAPLLTPAAGQRSSASQQESESRGSKRVLYAALTVIALVVVGLVLFFALKPMARPAPHTPNPRIETAVPVQPVVAPPVQPASPEPASPEAATAAPVAPALPSVEPGPSTDPSPAARPQPRARNRTQDPASADQAQEQPPPTGANRGYKNDPY